MSIEAITWALNASTGDSTTKMVLVALANHAHRDGRHSWPSKETIATYAECSTKTVQRTLKSLVAAGWIREGDQQQVGHLRADRRPVVYDLAMFESTRAVWAGWHATEASEGPSGRVDTMTPRLSEDEHGTTAQRGDKLSTRLPASETSHGGTHGGTTTTSRGDTRVPQTVLTPGTSPQPPASGGRTACSRHPEGLGLNCRTCGTTDRQLEEARRRDDATREREASRRAFEQRMAEKAAAAATVDVASAAARARELIARNSDA